MKLLIVTHYFPEHGGGIERIALQIADRLASRCVQLRWLASAEAMPTNAPGGEGFQAWNGLERRFGIPYPVFGVDGLQRLKAAIRWCDVVHLHDSLYVSNVVAARLASRAKRPMLVTQHVGLVPYRSQILRTVMEMGNRYVASRVLSKASRVVFYSRTTQTYFENLTPFSAPAYFIPNGVAFDRFAVPDASRRQAVRSELGWPTDRLVFLFAGRFVEKKGLHLLAKLAQDMPDVTWVFAGWGPLDPARWTLPNVICLGRQSQESLARVYAAADLLVLPSVGEGFPLVVQEAMACGTPVATSADVARAHAGCESLIWHSDPDLRPFGALLRSITSDREALTARRPQVSSFARREWSWERCVDGYQRLLLELYDGRGMHAQHSS